MKSLIILAWYFELNAIACESEMANPYRKAILAQRGGAVKWERFEEALERRFERVRMEEEEA